MSQRTLCDHMGTPTYAKVRLRGHQCWSSGSENISAALRLDDEEAIASMVEKALEPLVPYPGSVKIPWKALCTLCETVLDPGPRLHNNRGMSRGCSNCEERGIKPTKPGDLYRVVHDPHKALKWGTANIEHRLTQDKFVGWECVARWDFDLTRDAWAFERQIKIWERGQAVPKALIGLST